MFQKGQSGNPKGRPPGETPQTRVRKAINDALPEIMAVTVAQAKTGDMQAIKILLDKVMPNVKPQALPVTIEQGKDLTETSANVITETFTGKIAPDIGSMLITALANQAKIIEQADIVKRLEALENESQSKNS